MKPLWTGIALAALLGASTGCAGTTSEVRRDRLVGPHPNAWLESERPETGVEKMDRRVRTGSPRGEAGRTVVADGTSSDRLDRRVPMRSPRGVATWGR